MPRNKCFGKRKFRGNRYTCKSTISTADASPSSMDVSASEEKMDLSAVENDDLESKQGRNIIIDLDLLSLLLNRFAKCKNCGQTENFDIFEEGNSRKGLTILLIYICTACGHSTSGITSKISSKCYDINIRFTYTMRCTGKAKKAADTFYAVMNLPPLPSNFKKGEKYSHKHSLPEPVLSAVKNVFRSLSDRKLLSKCTYGRTQNPNESFNHCLWERLPKNVFVSMSTLQLGVLDAVICFKDGAYNRTKVIKSLGIEPGHNMKYSLRKFHEARVREASLRFQKLSKSARVKNKMIKQKNIDAEMLN